MASVGSNKAATKRKQAGMRHSADADDLPSTSSAALGVDNGKYQTVCST